jgi:hypothetical protein
VQPFVAHFAVDVDQGDPYVPVINADRVKERFFSQDEVESFGPALAENPFEQVQVLGRSRRSPDRRHLAT